MIGCKWCYNCMRSVNIDYRFCTNCGFDLSAQNPDFALPMGSTLWGKYIVGKMVDRDDIEIVYVGLDIDEHCLVTVREYFPFHMCWRDRTGNGQIQTTDPEFEEYRRRYLTEAQKRNLLPPLPQILGQKDVLVQFGTAYVITAPTSGMTLRQMSREMGAMNAIWLLNNLHPAMRAMQQIHDSGILHGGLSPDHLLYTPEGEVQIHGFGEVRCLAGMDKTTRAIIPDPFAAPEQLTRRLSEPATDVYRFCAAIYFCLTGRRPESPQQRLTEGERIDWTGARSLTVQQAKVLEQGMALRIEERIRSFRELEQRLFAAGPVLRRNPGEEYPATIPWR